MIATPIMPKSSLASSFRLKRAKKEIDFNEFSTRVKPPVDTLAQIGPICEKIGVTRISDITYMDKLYLPNYSIFLPGTEDSIWVYSGKGPSKILAKVSALMESIERYCSLSSTYSTNFVQGTYLELSKIYNKVLHPDEVVEPALPTYNDVHTTIDYVPGFDLLQKEEVLVPAQLALSRYFTKGKSDYAFHYSHTNGLASGNVLEEAVCHALCEVIERDAVSIADLCASSIPFTILRNVYSSTGSKCERYRFSPMPEDEFVDDPSLFQDVDISEISKFEPINDLVKRFKDTGIPLLIKNITQKDIGIATFVASSIEWITSDYGLFAKGYGTHLDARIALVRAITELSQTRAANIQGARDDLRKIYYRENDEIYKRKWQFMPSTFNDKKNNKFIMFSDIKTFVNEDILDDIKLILNVLKKAGFRRVIVVNLTDSNVGIPVVRAIVPGLETFEIAKLFTSTNLFMGNRAKSYFQKIQSTYK